ncbi:MAG TPA: hypothetical protein VL283_05120, partial [Candidatus Baltobacteraceae bacterium]|nr:hypothetical protein [Candidatus Baltobacteraceae bacterium]
LFLVGTLMASDRLTTARHDVDDGSEDPESASYRVYELSIRSSAHSIGAWVAFMPLGAGAVAAFAGTTLAASLVALLLAGLSLVIADAIRTRHGRIERAFEQLAGRPIHDIYLKVIDRSARTQ